MNGASLRNQDVRNYAAGKGVRLWQLAEQIGYRHSTRLSEELRHELSDDRKREMFAAIDEIAGQEVNA